MNSGISADDWNRRVVDYLRDRQIVSVTRLLSGGWRHPWQVSPYYDGALGLWRANIEPGFMNGLPATVQLTVAQAPDATISRIASNPQSAIRNPQSLLDSPLIDEPAVMLTGWRALGSDADPASVNVDDSGTVTRTFEPVPAFFLALGVAGPPNADGTSDADPATRRLLRAVDVVLYQDRAGTASNVTLGAPGDSIIASFSTVAVQPADARLAPYIRIVSSYVPPANPDTGAILTGTYYDGTRDQWLLGTVYLVSPAGASPGDLPGPAWESYVAHSLFWNRNYATQNVAPVVEQTLSLDTGLAAGLGDRINDFILGTINDSQSAAAAFLAAAALGGKAWTV